MLKTWSIQNFKPIVDSGQLQLAPVTVLAGLNSSGKSSLLQSILMIAQTLSSRVVDRALLPNEAIVQLGTFQSVLSSLAPDRTLTVGFELQLEHEDGPRSLKFRNALIQSIRVKASFGSIDNKRPSTSALEASKVVVEDVSIDMRSSSRIPQSSETEKLEFRVSITRASAGEIVAFLTNVPSRYHHLLPFSDAQIPYFGRLQWEIKYNDPYDDPDIQLGPYLVSLSHFLPSRLIRKYNEVERRQISAEMNSHFHHSHPQTQALLGDLETPIRADLKARLMELCEASGIKAIISATTVGELASWYLSLEDPGKMAIKDAINAIIQDTIEQFQSLDITSELLEIYTNSVYTDALEEAVAEINRFFTSDIRYLGPLRADPQAAQRFAPSGFPDDVGVKGEYAAAVFDANQEAAIEWYDPKEDGIVTSTLRLALGTWARYLGVAIEVGIETAGQSGVSWQIIHREGQKPLPLTAVGVGVSQVLPILVMGLLAPSNTLLIMEQPELHLHPRVQARLGEFFVGLAKCGKQCLVETHSENLISQLRHHIVRSGGQEASDCAIYFVDQDASGAARFQPVQISPSGQIMNWPEGFFDETLLQEDRILEASLKRRAQLAAHD